MKAIEQYLHLVMFITLYKVVLNFKSVDETLVCDHLNESCRAVLSCGTVCYAVEDRSKLKLFKSVDETLVCKHSNESYRRIFVYNICLISISNSVSNQATEIK